MIYLIILSLITFLLAFAAKLLITYFLIKFFNRKNSFWSIFKPILLYEVGVFCFFIIKPASLIYVITIVIPRIFLFPLYFLISVVLLFLIFKFIMQKFSLLNFKKSLIVFLLMFLLITPALSFSRSTAEVKIAEKLPISVAEQYNFQEMMQQFFFQSYTLKSSSQMIYEKIYRLNDIFLEEELLRELRNFIITWPF
jgi:hypothetical protein